jgi:outer membrane lipopolysaccharide assembly protein LptE/RlpB
MKKILSILFFILLWGCGYQLAGKETHLPPGVNSVTIPTLINKTLEPGIEVPFTQAFLKEFIQDRRVKVVDRADADSILEGTIKSFYLISVSYDQSGRVTEYQTAVVVDITLKKRTGEVFWAEKDLLDRAWYRTSPNVISNEDNKQNAILQIAQSLAERIRNRFFYNF